MALRIYDKCPMNPRGTPEDVSRCFESVASGNGWHYIQCSRKRGHGKGGLYCKQHAKHHPSECSSE